MRIKTVTTSYNPDEDRLCMAAVDEAGQQRVLWVTRRMAERLVPALTQGMAAPAAEEVPPAPDAQAQAPDKAAQSQAAQVYAQLEARLAHKAPPPVEPGPQTPQGLVYEITLKASDNGARGMEFHCRGLDSSELVLTPRELRLWLHQVHVGFRAAQWREDIWPAWITAG